MTIMVTGGNGLIGSRVIRELVRRGEEVVNFDQTSPRFDWMVSASGVTIYRGDVTNISHLLEGVKKYKVRKIIHMAALLPPETESRPHYGMLVNIQGTNNVFEVARWSNVERVVYASSIAVYGIQETYGQQPINEDDAPNPVNIYGMTKAANDFAASKYIASHSLDLRGIRICTVFGHGRTTGMTGMIGGLMISKPAVGEPIDLPFHPDEPSPMIHAEDAAQIFVETTMSKGLNHPVYISGGHLATVGDIAAIVRKLIPDAMITMGDQKVPHVFLVDNNRMLADIGYEIAPLETRLKEHINEARLEAGIEPLN